MAQHLWFPEFGQNTNTPEIIGRLNDVQPHGSQKEPRREYHPDCDCNCGADGVYRQQSIAPLLCPGSGADDPRVRFNWWEESCQGDENLVDDEGCETPNARPTRHYDVSDADPDNCFSQFDPKLHRLVMNDGCWELEVLSRELDCDETSGERPALEGMGRLPHNRGWNETRRDTTSWHGQTRARRQYLRHAHRRPIHVGSPGVIPREIVEDFSDGEFCETRFFRGPAYMAPHVIRLHEAEMLFDFDEECYDFEVYGDHEENLFWSDLYWLEFAGKLETDHEFARWEHEQRERRWDYLEDLEESENKLAQKKVDRNHPWCPQANCRSCKLSGDCTSYLISCYGGCDGDDQNDWPDVYPPDDPWEDCLRCVKLNGLPVTAEDVESMIRAHEHEELYDLWSDVDRPYDDEPFIAAIDSRTRRQANLAERRLCESWKDLGIPKQWAKKRQRFSAHSINHGREQADAA